MRGIAMLLTLQATAYGLSIPAEGLAVGRYVPYSFEI
jgi:hypothetical protein